MLTVFGSFGWVNASYVYGLQIVNAHMKRALGAVTTWDTFKKMTEGNAAAAKEAFEPPKSVHVAPHVQEAVGHDAKQKATEGGNGHLQHLPHSKEDEHAHQAVFGGHENRSAHGHANGKAS